ncbi:RagB/SusD family nutrient uptake outer membrane protein, partial [Chitinophaga sp.]|uniref:RagB/SusD family nutrient uptake outer membrane protein n=1 Tax=Chitinophaga sp. TaxID=1869181 RepID=UPI002F938F2C
MRKIHLSIITCLLLLSGCTKFLDIKPKDKFIPVTVADYEGLLNSANNLNYGDYYWDLMSDDAFLPEGQPGNLFSKQAPSGRKIYTFNSLPYAEGNLDFEWSEGYKRIFYSNTIINNVMDATEGTEAAKKGIRAEALLSRAMEHLLLVNMYAQHYDAATAATQLGIPIALIADINAKFKRNTVQEVYDQVISDINAALPDLPQDHKLTKFRASKAGGYAALSRVYLFMGDYANAKKNADLTLALQSELANMNDYKIINPGPFPNVPASPLGWTDIPDCQNNKETIVAR